MDSNGMAPIPIAGDAIGSVGSTPRRIPSLLFARGFEMRQPKAYKTVKLLCQKCGGPIYLSATHEKQNPKKEPPHCPYCGMEIGKVDVPPMKTHGSWHKWDRAKETG